VRRPRSDAARNRERLLGAARSLLADRAFDDVTTDEIAGAARVGKGTLYRAFGSKAGLARALLDDEERALQEAILTGPPPLGPGNDVPPHERIQAFVEAYAALLERDADLLIAADAGTTARFRTGAYGGWLMHLRSQVRRLGTDIDDESAAHAVLALLAPELHVHLRREAGCSAAHYATAVKDLAAGIVGR
jgi:AcrR family transcriptional regulator